MGYIKLEYFANKGVQEGQNPLKKTVFNNNESIAMKFNTEIIMGYMRLENLHTNGALGGQNPQKTAFKSNEQTAIKF